MPDDALSSCGAEDACALLIKIKTMHSVFTKIFSALKNTIIECYLTQNNNYHLPTTNYPGVFDTAAGRPDTLAVRVVPPILCLQNTGLNWMRWFDFCHNFNIDRQYYIVNIRSSVGEFVKISIQYQLTLCWCNWFSFLSIGNIFFFWNNFGNWANGVL